MTGKQRSLSAILGVSSLFAGGALMKSSMKIGPLLGGLLLLYGTVALVGTLTEPGENKKQDSKPGAIDKLIDGEGPKSGCFLLSIFIGGVLLIGYLQSVHEKVGFSIVGVILMGLIFWGVSRIGGK